MSKPSTSSVKIKIRVPKKESAFVYFILESHEGVSAYSTLPHREGDQHRDLELMVAPDFLTDAEGLLKELGPSAEKISNSDSQV